MMGRGGYAWVFSRYSATYDGHEALAKSGLLDVHRHGCMPGGIGEWPSASGLRVVWSN